jgi:hypothetical protein
VLTQQRDAGVRRNGHAIKQHGRSAFFCLNCA